MIGTRRTNCLLLGLLLSALLLTACSRETSPTGASFLPETTVSLTMIDSLELMRNPNTYAHDAFPSAAFDQLIRAAGLDETRLQRATLFANGASPALVLETPEAATLFARLQESGTIRRINAATIIEFPSPSGLPDAELWGWTVIGDEQLAVGGMSAIEQLIAVEQGDLPNLYAGRPELQPMLRTFADRSAAAFEIMPEQTANAEEVLGPIVQRVVSGSLGRAAGIFASLRAMVTTGEHYDDGCSMTLGFQFSDQPAAVVAQGAGALLFGLYALDDSAWDSPETSNVTRDGTLVVIDMTWGKAACLKAMERDGVVIPSSDVSASSNSATAQQCGAAIVTSTNGVNVRAEANVEAAIVTKLAYQAKVTMRCAPVQDGGDYTWVPISTPAGDGWVAGEFLRFDN